MSHELVSTLASIQEVMVGMTGRLDQLESSFHKLPLIAVGTNETVPLAP